MASRCSCYIMLDGVSAYIVALLLPGDLAAYMICDAKCGIISQTALHRG